MHVFSLDPAGSGRGGPPDETAPQGSAHILGMATFHAFKPPPCIPVHAADSSPGNSLSRGLLPSPLPGLYAMKPYCGYISGEGSHTSRTTAAATTTAPNLFHPVMTTPMV